MKPKARYGKGGCVAKIRRDNYGPNWYSKVAEIQKRDDNQCMQCKAVGGTLRGDGSKVSIHTHHARRLTRGGTTTNANLLSLCNYCHAKRHSHL